MCGGGRGGREKGETDEIKGIMGEDNDSTDNDDDNDNDDDTNKGGRCAGFELTIIADDNDGIAEDDGVADDEYVGMHVCEYACMCVCVCVCVCVLLSRAHAHMCVFTRAHTLT